MMTIKILINNVETDKIDIVNQWPVKPEDGTDNCIYAVTHYNFLDEVVNKDNVVHSRSKGRFNLAEIVSKKLSKKVK